MRKYALTLLLCICLVPSLFSQIKDSISVALKTDPTFFIAFHNRNLIVASEPLKLYGVIGGLDYSNKVQLYMGIYGLSDQRPTLLINNPEFASDTVVRSFSTNNFSLGGSYTFYKWGRLSLSVPGQIGLGVQQLRYTDSAVIRTDEWVYAPLETGVNAFFEVHKYIGIKGGLGYRLNIGKKKVREYSSPYYNLGISILLGKIYKDVFKK